MSRTTWTLKAVIQKNRRLGSRASTSRTRLVWLIQQHPAHRRAERSTEHVGVLLHMTCVPVTHIRSPLERKHPGPADEPQQGDPANRRKWLSEKEGVKYTPL